MYQLLKRTGVLVHYLFMSEVLLMLLICLWKGEGYLCQITNKCVYFLVPSLF